MNNSVHIFCGGDSIQNTNWHVLIESQSFFCFYNFKILSKHTLVTKQFQFPLAVTTTTIRLRAMFSSCDTLSYVLHEGNNMFDFPTSDIKQFNFVFSHNGVLALSYIVACKKLTLFQIFYINFLLINFILLPRIRRTLLSVSKRWKFVFDKAHGNTHRLKTSM